MRGRETVRRFALAIVMVLGVAPVALTLAPSASAAPVGCPTAPSGLFRYAPGSGKTVALTFDDGPGKSTAQIVSILQQAHVTATFFNIGVHEQENPSLVSLEQGAGFALGDHTWDHQTLTTLSTSQQASEIDRERAEQASITGQYPCFLRPPGGSYNATTLTLAQQRGMQVFNWSIDTEDWKADGSADPYWVNRIRTRAEDASITHPVVLMHNQVGGNPATVAALPDIINFYKANGYRFVDLYGSTGLPTVTSVSPVNGPTAGGTRVRVYGTNFQSVTGVVFTHNAGTAIHVVTSTELLVTAPTRGAGTSDVRVVTRHGTSPVTTHDHFHYVAPPTVKAIAPTTGPTAGGTRVTVVGTSFVGTVTVLFGDAAGTGIHYVTPEKVLVTAPAGTAGVVPVVVKTAYGTSSATGPTFTYADPPPPAPTSSVPPTSSSTSSSTTTSSSTDTPPTTDSVSATDTQTSVAASAAAATVPVRTERGGVGAGTVWSELLLIGCAMGLMVAVLRKSRSHD